jgi:UDP-N-acetylglucosamine 2-epimerase (non-hydrolysing)
MTMRGNFVDIVAGARPNFMKAGPIYQAIEKAGHFGCRFVYSGQHTSYVMSDEIYEWVGLPMPEVLLGQNLSPGLDYLGQMMTSYDMSLKYGPHMPLSVIVVGDTDTSLAAAIVAARNKVPIVHVEAGVRSHDKHAPEEQNRIMIDSISDLLLTPFEEATSAMMLQVDGQVKTVGNVMVDSLNKVMSSEKFKAIETDPIDILVTIHRQANVTGTGNLPKILKNLDELSKDWKVKFPVHPRTQAEFNRTHRYRDYMYEPMSYPEFLSQMKNSKAVITDSGGVQAEAAVLGIPCFVLRDSTGWQNLLELGLVSLINLNDMCNVVASSCDNGECHLACSIPGWEDNAADRIAHYVHLLVQSRL